MIIFMTNGGGTIKYTHTKKIKKEKNIETYP